jgi:hypothetical protein
MTVLNTAAAIRVGTTAATAVYAGTVKVWPTAPPPPANIAHAQDDGTNMMIWDQYRDALKANAPWSLDIVCSPLFRTKTGACRTLDAASADIGLRVWGEARDVTVQDWVAAADSGGASLTYSGVGWMFQLRWTP